MSKRLNVILYEPEIPQNTGNIMRSCVAFNAKLHLIKPLGFSLDEKHLKRASVDYFEYLDYEVYDNLDDFYLKNKDLNNIYYLTRYGHKSPTDFDFSSINKDENIYLMFGRESTGIPYNILHDNLDKCIRIPTTDNVRSLNLSNTVAIMLYKVTSDLDYCGLLSEEPEKFKGKDFIDNYKE